MYIEINLLFIAIVSAEMAQVAELHQMEHGELSVLQCIPWMMMISRRKEPMHQQT